MVSKFLLLALVSAGYMAIGFTDFHPTSFAYDDGRELNPQPLPPIAEGELTTSTVG